MTFDPLIEAADRFQASLAELFQTDPERVDRYVIEVANLRMDYSRHWLTDDTLKVLADCLETRDFAAKRQDLFAGEPVNRTESRAALHMALRAPRHADYRDQGEPVMDKVHTVLDAMQQFSEAVRSGALLGSTGRAFTDVVQVGIGGSDLGPAVAVDALKPFADGPALHFVSNVDGARIKDVLAPLNPETTLCLVISKTFTTQETMHNAGAVRAWLSASLGADAAPAHLAAVSTNEPAMDAFGVPVDRRFAFWDWVGGRYSLWSAVGLGVMLAVGAANYRALLAGAHAMDRHFVDAPATDNVPVMMALISLWYTTGFGMETHAVVPYSERLTQLPRYLQQLEMESNGKSVDQTGVRLEYDTAPVIWGGAGTDGQHAFFQALHQGTRFCPMDVWLAANPVDSERDAHRLLMANCLAQLDALSFGSEQRSGHRACPGNRPATLFLYEALTPEVLGAMLAAYEHKVFTLAVLWDINPFDQFGVELGKVLCRDVLKRLEAPQSSLQQSATDRAIAWIQKHRH